MDIIRIDKIKGFLEAESRFRQYWWEMMNSYEQKVTSRYCLKRAIKFKEFN